MIPSAVTIDLQEFFINSRINYDRQLSPIIMSASPRHTHNETYEKWFAVPRPVIFVCSVAVKVISPVESRQQNCASRKAISRGCLRDGRSHDEGMEKKMLCVLLRSHIRSPIPAQIVQKRIYSVNNPIALKQCVSSAFLGNNDVGSVGWHLWLHNWNLNPPAVDFSVHKWNVNDKGWGKFDSIGADDKSSARCVLCMTKQPNFYLLSPSPAQLTSGNERLWKEGKSILLIFLLCGHPKPLLGCECEHL